MGFPLAQLLLALCFGLWIPLRLVFFHNFFSIDIALDAVTVLIVGTDLLPKIKTKKITLFSEFHNVLVLLPLVSMGYFLSNSFLPYLYMFKFLYLSRLNSIRTITEKIDSLHPIVARLFPLAFILPIVVHLVACGWILLGNGDTEYTQATGIVYVRAFYWAVTTLATVGYGDIVPKTVSQMIFASCTMIVGVGFFGYILSNVASLLSRLDAAREHQTQTLDRVESYMRYNNIPPNLQSRVREYFRYLWDNNHGYEDKEILSQIPTNLQLEIALAMNAKIIEKVPLLIGADETFIRELVSKLEHKIALPDEKLFNFGDTGDAMYFVHRGQIEIHSQYGEKIATLKEGAFFGETALVTSNPRNATAWSPHYSDLFILKREDFEVVLKKHPKFAERIMAQQHQRNIKLKKSA